MSSRLRAKNPLYPIIAVLSTVIILVLGLVFAKNGKCIYFLGVVWLLLFVFGYRRTCIVVIPFAIIMCLIMGGLTYLISKDMAHTSAAINRVLALAVAVIPGLGMAPIDLVRNLSELKLPRMITLGMMITVSFFPLLSKEVKQIREAMRTRGAGNIFNPTVFYRAFLIPLIMRIVNISDTLALSVETRGFSPEGEYSVYTSVRPKTKDFIFVAAIIAAALVIIYR